MKVGLVLFFTSHVRGIHRLNDTSTPAMNLSHVITEFSFGPFFPDITQPLDSSLEIAHERKSLAPYSL